MTITLNDLRENYKNINKTFYANVLKKWKNNDKQDHFSRMTFYVEQIVKQAETNPAKSWAYINLLQQEIAFLQKNKAAPVPGLTMEYVEQVEMWWAELCTAGLGSKTFLEALRAQYRVISGEKESKEEMPLHNPALELQETALYYVVVDLPQPCTVKKGLLGQHKETVPHQPYEILSAIKEGNQGFFAYKEYDIAKSVLKEGGNKAIIAVAIKKNSNLVNADRRLFIQANTISTIYAAYTSSDNYHTFATAPELAKWQTEYFVNMQGDNKKSSKRANERNQWDAVWCNSVKSLTPNGWLDAAIAVANSYDTKVLSNKHYGDQVAQDIGAMQSAKRTRNYFSLLETLKAKQEGIKGGSFIDQQNKNIKATGTYYNLLSYLVEQLFFHCQLAAEQAPIANYEEKNRKPEEKYYYMLLYKESAVYTADTKTTALMFLTYKSALAYSKQQKLEDQVEICLAVCKKDALLNSEKISLVNNKGKEYKTSRLQPLYSDIVSIFTVDEEKAANATLLSKEKDMIKEAKYIPADHYFMVTKDSNKEAKDGNKKAKLFNTNSEAQHYIQRCLRTASNKSEIINYTIMAVELKEKLKIEQQQETINTTSSKSESQDVVPTVHTYYLLENTAAEKIMQEAKGLERNYWQLKLSAK